MNQLVRIEPNSNVEAYRASTDAAGICKEIVVRTAKPIQGRKYVCVEGWQAIAIAHGCTASARDVERVDGGYKAIGEIRRMADGCVIAEAEGFVGEDEPTWFGGKVGSKMLPKRADYAIRAMAQTRAISRACRSAFAHVVVMMDAGLSTTPAEEVPMGGFDEVPASDQQREPQQRRPEPRSEPAAEKAVKEPEGGWGNWARDTIDFIGRAKSVEVLDEFKEAETGRIIAVKKVDKMMFDTIRKADADRRKLLAGEILDDEIPY